MKFCECGCGSVLRSDKVRFMPNCARKVNGLKGAEMNKGIPNLWNGGQTIDKDGYVLVYHPDHRFCNSQGYVRKHRLLYEL